MSEKKVEVRDRQLPRRDVRTLSVSRGRSASGQDEVARPGAG